MRALPVGIPKIMVSTVASGDVASYVGASRHHDVPFGRRRAGPEFDHRAGACQRRACDGRHGRATADAEAGKRSRRLARPARRHHHVRGHHALPCRRSPAARGRLRLPGLPRHRHRRARDGEPRRFRHARGAASTSPPPRSPTCSSAASFRRPRTASAPPSAPAFPMSARSARSTWSISVRATRVPEKFRDRNFVIHNPNVTLMRTTRDENRAIGAWIGARLNAHERAGALPAARGRRVRARRAGQAVPRSGGRQRAVRGDREDRPAERRSARSSGCRPTSTSRPSSTAVIAAFHAVAPKLQRRA